METIERGVWRKVKAMTRNEVIVRAIAGELKWIRAAEICGITARQMRRLKTRYERYGYDGLVDGRSGTPRRKRIPLETIKELCDLKRERYADFSVQHFWEKVTEVHGIEISYTWTKLTLQAAGLAEKERARGTYRRKRERRPQRGMMLHLDASMHAWLAGLPQQDLMVLLDDADSQILYARFVPEENTLATFAALAHVLRTHGRFAEFYTDRGSHFCHTPVAGEASTTEHQGQVSRALKALGIRQILARSPEARGRSERMFGTLQGRLPQELRLAGITSYAAANAYLTGHFLADCNRRFTVDPAEAPSAFIPLVGVDLELLLSAHHDRVVRNDSTVSFRSQTLQLPPSAERPHYVRCPVLVHEFPDATLGISYQGRLLARYTADGQFVEPPRPDTIRPRAVRAGAPAARPAQAGLPTAGPRRAPGGSAKAPGRWARRER
jgi:hypothetical protein